MSDDDDQADLIAANAAFYRAFAAGDFDAMAGLWAEAAPVTCVHPGWPPMRGRDQVMQSWAGILAHPPRPAIRVIEPDGVIYGDTAQVTCWEAIGDIFLVASNLFLRERGAWKMVHHHSGPTERQPRSESRLGSRAVH